MLRGGVRQAQADAPLGGRFGFGLHGEFGWIVTRLLFHRRDLEFLPHAIRRGDAFLAGRAAGEAFRTATRAGVDGRSGLGLAVAGNDPGVPAAFTLVCSDSFGGNAASEQCPRPRTLRGCIVLHHHDSICAFGARHRLVVTGFGLSRDPSFVKLHELQRSAFCGPIILRVRHAGKERQGEGHPAQAGQRAFAIGFHSVPFFVSCCVIHERLAFIPCYAVPMSFP